MARSTLTRKLLAFATLGATVAATLGALTFGTYLVGSTVVDMFADDSIDAKRLANQVWIERLPTDDRDMIHHLVLVEDGGDRFGGFGKSSQWRHFVELFRWAREDSRLIMLLPQERKRLELGVKVWNCEGEAPAPFQLCLELSNKRKTMTYYSRHDWSIDANDPDALADLVAATPQLAGALELPTAPAATDLDTSNFAVVEGFAE